MKNSKMILIIGALVLAILVAIFGSIVFLNSWDNEDNSIPDGYVAVFHGGSGEETYETYIYKENNGQSNSGFSYINVTSTTKSWGSGEWNSRVTKRGSVQWTDDIFTVARENNAYSYVTLPNNDTIYTIQEFMGMFLMN